MARKKIGRYRFKTRPRRYQIRALRVLLRNRGGGLFMPMRSGKTKVALDFVGCMNQAFGVSRVLVACPLSAKGVWHREIAKHFDLEGRNVTFVVVNYEKLYSRARIDGTRSWDPVDNETLGRFLEGGKSVMICDESHRIGDPGTLQSRYAWRLGRHADYRVFMTGTPMHRGPLKIFGQMKFYDDGVFGTRWTHFKKMFGLWGGYGNKKLLRFMHLDLLREKVRPHIYHMKHLPTLHPQHEVVPVELGPTARRVYQEMAMDSYADLSRVAGVQRGADEPEEVRGSSAGIVLTRILRLSQISGGHIRSDDGAWVRVHSDLRRSFRDWLADREEEGLRKLVVYARFTRELIDAAEVAGECGYRVLLFHGKVPWDTREQRLAEFDESEDKVAFVCQVGTGSEGIDLSSAPVAVYYSLTEDLVAFDQSAARIRKYKDKITRSYFYFVPRDTIAEVMLASLRAKRNVVEVVLNNPELVKEGVDE